MSNAIVAVVEHSGLAATLGSSVERAPWGWGVFFMLVAGSIKYWPVFQLQLIKAREALRAEKRGERIDQDTRISNLEAKLETMTRQSHKVEMQLVSAMAACRLVTGELQRLDPDSPILKQAQVLLSGTNLNTELAEILGKME